MIIKKIKNFLFFILTLLFFNKGFSLVTVTSNANSGAGTLRAALTGAAIGETIEFNLPAGSTTITISSPLPFIVNNLTINGTNAAGKVTISGQSLYPGFVVTNGTVSISELNIQNCRSKGGDGGLVMISAAGGGGMGAGGGIFINNTANVTLSGLNFDNCSVLGGEGGDWVSFIGLTGGTGGGGLGGNGAMQPSPDPNVGGGGGGLYANATGKTGVGGGGNGGDGTPGSNGGDFGGGGGAGTTTGGNGGFAGGGGGGNTSTGGNGGFGGGGGGSGDGAGGSGGFGGGNGGAGDGAIASPGAGGGGAGFGGAIFLRTSGALVFNSDITSNQSTSQGAAGSGGVTSPLATNGSNNGSGIYLMSSTILNLNPSINETRSIAAQISGPGGITKNGLGTYNITSTNNYTGATTVNTGTLVINGSIATSTTTVGSSGTLKGTGTVGPLTVSGILKPGNSIGTITVVGDYTQAAGSTLQIEIDAAGNASKVQITGSATINSPSTLQVMPQGGDYAVNRVYTILEAAGGRTGEFSSFIIVNPDELDGGELQVSYTSNLVQLIFTTNVTSRVKAATFITNNLLNLANHIQSNNIFDQSILRYYQMNCPCHKKNIRPYFLASYFHGHYKTRSYTQAAPFSLTGGLVGLDYWSQNNIIIGGFFNYFKSWSKSDNQIIKTSSDNYQLSWYIQKFYDRYFIEGALSGSYVDFDMDRFLNNNKVNDASFTGFGISAQTKGCRIFKVNNINILPSLALRYFYNQINSYKEKIEISNRLDIGAQKNNILEILMTVLFSKTFYKSFGAIIPQIELGYIRDLLGEKISFDAKLVNSSAIRTIKIKPNSNNVCKLQAALDFRFCNCSILTLSYTANLANHQRLASEAHLGYRIDF